MSVAPDGVAGVEPAGVGVDGDSLRMSEAIETLGFVPNQQARAPRRR